MRDEVRALFVKQKVRAAKTIISVAVDDEILEALDEITKEFGIHRSDACRKILRLHLTGKIDEYVSPDRHWVGKTRPRGDKLKKRNDDIMKAFVEQGRSMKELMSIYDLGEKQITKILNERGVWDRSIAYPEIIEEDDAVPYRPE